MYRFLAIGKLFKEMSRSRTKLSFSIQCGRRVSRFIREQTLDANELAIYWSEIGATFIGHPVKVLASYGRHEDLEGPPTEGTVVAEFPSMEAAQAWYHSPLYADVRRHRIKGAVYRGVLVEGV
jgi:uncharacterized protein (DUF1330 family)